MGKGGIIGKSNDPTGASASGVWSLEDQFIAKRDSFWPVGIQGEMTYTWYKDTLPDPTTEAGLDALFTTATAGVTFGGTGIHSTTINWSNGAAGTGAGGAYAAKPAYLPTNNFSWMVQSNLYAPETGTYTFGIDCDDAGDVHVNGTRVAHFYGSHGFAGVWSGNPNPGFTTQTTGTIVLQAGKTYSFRARVQNGEGGDGIQVGWRKPSDSSIAVIPATFFYRSA